MVYKNKAIFLLLFTVFIFIVFPFKAYGEDNLEQIQEKLNSISEEEKQILKTLFIQVQEIEELERKNDNLELEINEMEKEVKIVEKNVKRAEEGYEKNLLGLEKVLKSYQRMGAGSYLEIILESDSLTNFIRRVNILRDLSRNSKELLQKIDRDKENLEKEKEKLEISLEQLQEKQREVEEVLNKKRKLVQEKENYLNSLKDDKQIYIDRLEYISLIMNELKNILGEFTEKFDKLIKSGGFPRDAVEEKITLKGVRGTIRQKTFNDIVSSNEDIPKMKFQFNEGEISMNVPDKDLYLSGNFVIEDNTILKFQPKVGSFLKMPLEKGTMDELFREGNFILNLKPLIGNVKIKSVEIKQQYIEIMVNIF